VYGPGVLSNDARLPLTRALHSQNDLTAQPKSRTPLQSASAVTKHY
jgi:hypothetical protein